MKDYEQEILNKMKKNDIVKMVYGCYDDYVIIIKKKLKHKLVGEVISFNNNKDDNFEKDFLYQYIRSISQ